MLKVTFTTKFKKDLKRAEKRGYKMKKLNHVIEELIDDRELPPKYRDHALTESKHYHDARECHIEPDWLLVYRKNDETLTLLLLRTGTHSDLFD